MSVSDAQESKFKHKLTGYSYCLFARELFTFSVHGLSTHRRQLKRSVISTGKRQVRRSSAYLAVIYKLYNTTRPEIK